MSTIIIDDDHVDAPLLPKAITYGLIGGILGVVMLMIQYNLGYLEINPETGQPNSSIVFTILSIVIGFAVIFLGIKAYRDSDNNGALSLKQGLLWSLLYGAIGGIISALGLYLVYAVLAPEIIDGLAEFQIATLEDQGLSESEIEAATGMMGMFMSPAFFAVAAFLGSIFMSVIMGLIASLILKTR